MNDLALNIQDLCKSYGDKQAVDRLNLKVKRGEFYALLGSNGAGKTTTLRMIAGLLEPDSGDAAIAGHSITETPMAAKQALAYVPDEPLLYAKLRPMEYLEFVAGLWSIPPDVAQPQAYELLERMELWDARDKFCESFSRGMKQKLMLAAAFIHSPTLMILDEPLLGLDASAARLVKDMIAEFIRKGNSVVMTTHIMEIAERIASRIGIIRDGRLLAEGSLDELAQKAGTTDGTLESIFISLTRD
ncbi:MAG: ABC transporter ATP-binding protein [Synechococcus sp.]